MDNQPPTEQIKNLKETCFHCGHWVYAYKKESIWAVKCSNEACGRHFSFFNSLEELSENLTIVDKELPKARVVSSPIIKEILDDVEANRHNDKINFAIEQLRWLMATLTSKSIIEKVDKANAISVSHEIYLQIEQLKNQLK